MPNSRQVRLRITVIGFSPFSAGFNPRVALAYPEPNPDLVQAVFLYQGEARHWLLGSGLVDLGLVHHLDQRQALAGLVLGDLRSRNLQEVGGLVLGG